jgi:hypothetical protein
MPKEWEKEFPNLGKWTCTSKRTRDYNCIAFAARDETRRWEPFGGYYWPRPEEARNRGYSVEELIEVYKTEGFQVCADGNLVEGSEKIAIYVNNYGGWEHAARQESDGKWKSKLGDLEDILHDSPDALICTDYGRPAIFMERVRKRETVGKETEGLSTPSASENADAFEEAGPPIDASNPKHREDFNSLLNEAARKREPKD